MNQEQIFNLITTSFTKIFQNISEIYINNELDWERHIYVELRKNLGNQAFNRYVIYLEAGANKYGKDILWISPNKYQKKFDLINNFYTVQQDEGGHYKILLSKNLQPLDLSIKKLIRDEKSRYYYVDIVILDKKLYKSVAFIELKFGNDLSRDSILDDFYKLKRLQEVRDYSSIYIAVGFNSLNNQIIWQPTDSIYDYTFQVNQSVFTKPKQNLKPADLTADDIELSIKNSAVTIYNNVHATEATWVAELMFLLYEQLPEGWRINSEIPLRGETLGRIDLGIFESNIFHTAIELKNHFEQPFPLELLNNLSFDKSLQDDFIKQSLEFITKYESDKSIIKRRSTFPKNENGYYLNYDFFEKIIEIYYQCKRMSEMIRGNFLKEAYMVYIDHNDDYTLRTKTHSIPENKFIKNFCFRKSLIKKILIQGDANKCKFIYMFKLNSKNDMKKIFFIDNDK